MKKLVKHMERWNIWRKRNRNGACHHILVLFGLVRSPTFAFTLSKDEKKEIFGAIQAGIDSKRFLEKY